MADTSPISELGMFFVATVTALMVGTGMAALWAAVGLAVVAVNLVVDARTIQNECS